MKIEMTKIFYINYYNNLTTFDTRILFLHHVILLIIINKIKI